jgi:hypothetical protein
MDPLAIQMIIFVMAINDRPLKPIQPDLNHPRTWVELPLKASGRDIIE